MEQLQEEALKKLARWERFWLVSRRIEQKIRIQSSPKASEMKRDVRRSQPATGSKDQPKTHAGKPSSPSNPPQSLSLSVQTSDGPGDARGVAVVDTHIVN